MKNPQKITSDSNNLITPRKTTRQVVNKTNATIPTKSDRKTV